MSRSAFGAGSGQLVDRATYRARWSALHGGYDPAGSPLVGRWLSLVEVAARPLARLGVTPGAITAAGVVSAAAALPAALAGGRWRLAAGAAVVGSGLADSLDGAVAVLSEQASDWGFVVDSLADRAADTSYVLALHCAGAPRWAALAAAGSVHALEYGRARAGAAGYREIAVVTVGERPTRIIIAAAGLAAAGLLPGRARVAATGAAVTTAVAAAVGTGQFLRVVARDLRARQAAPINPATARADIATSGSPPPG